MVTILPGSHPGPSQLIPDFHPQVTTFLIFLFQNFMQSHVLCTLIKSSFAQQNVFQVFPFSCVLVVYSFLLIGRIPVSQRWKALGCLQFFNIMNKTALKHFLSVLFRRMLFLLIKCLAVELLVQRLVVFQFYNKGQMFSQRGYAS